MKILFYLKLNRDPLTEGPYLRYYCYRYTSLYNYFGCRLDEPIPFYSLLLTGSTFTRTMAKVKLGYWNVRAFAQPIRLLLAYSGTDFEDKRYNFIGPQWDRSEWLNEKFSHGLDFPNVS